MQRYAFFLRVSNVFSIFEIILFVILSSAKDLNTQTNATQILHFVQNDTT